MLTHTVLYTYILCHICNVTLVSQMPLWPFFPSLTVLYAPFLAEWLGCWTAYPEILGSNPVKSKNKFCQVEFQNMTLTLSY